MESNLNFQEHTTDQVLHFRNSCKCYVLSYIRIFVLGKAIALDCSMCIFCALIWVSSLFWMGIYLRFANQIHFSNMTNVPGILKWMCYKEGKYFLSFLLRLWCFRLSYATTIATDLWSLCHSGDRRGDCCRHGSWFGSQSA